MHADNPQATEPQGHRADQPETYTPPHVTAPPLTPRQQRRAANKAAWAAEQLARRKAVTARRTDPNPTPGAHAPDAPGSDPDPLNAGPSTIHTDHTQTPPATRDPLSSTARTEPGPGGVQPTPNTPGQTGPDVCTIHTPTGDTQSGGTVHGTRTTASSVSPARVNRQMEEASERRRAMGRLLGQGRTVHQAYRLAGYRGSPSGQAAHVARHPEVQAERARIVALAEAEATAAAVLTRRESLEIAARIARGELPAEDTSHEGSTPAGPTSWRRRRISPLDGVRAAAELEGWVQPAGAGQAVQIQIVLGGPPAGPGGVRVRGDGVVMGGDALPVGADGSTTPGPNVRSVLPASHNSGAVVGVVPQRVGTDADRA